MIATAIALISVGGPTEGASIETWPVAEVAAPDEAGPAAATAELRDALDLAARAAGLSVDDPWRGQAGPDPEDVVPFLEAEVERARRTVQEAHASGALETIRPAGLRLALALAHALPTLQSMADDLPGYLVDTGDTHHGEDENELLIIDWGGNDVWRNSAGGAHCFNPLEPPLFHHCVADVRVAVDLGGNDYYEPGYGALLAQPAAMGAGVAAIGILVDVGGSDTYAMPQSLPPTPYAPRWCSFCSVDRFLAQGAADRDGFGLLADLAAISGTDDDTFRSDHAPESAGDSWTRQRVYSQGAGLRGGTGILADARGASLYVAARDAQALGLEERGVGVLYDGSGDDTYVIHDPDHWWSAQSWWTDHHVGMRGQAYAETGATAVLFDRAGDDRYEAFSRAQGVGLGAKALGVSGLGSSRALLLDLDGADEYLLRTATPWRFGPGREGQGFADKDGNGWLVDASGNDSYSAPGGSAQGSNGGIVGFPGNVGGGVLADLAGDDAYDAGTDPASQGGTPACLRCPVLFDAEGSDAYSTGRDGCVSVRGFSAWLDCPPKGIFIDLDPAPSPPPWVPLGASEPSLLALLRPPIVDGDASLRPARLAVTFTDRSAHT